MKITAKEARELAGRTPQEEVEIVYPLIQEAARKKKRSIDLHGQFLAHGGYSQTKEWREAKKILEQDGFVVTFYYEELQFVNMFTIVSW
jgi:hypothetical protein